MKPPTVEMEQCFSNWQRGLTTDKRTQSSQEVKDRQDELIASVRQGSASLGKYLRTQLGIDAGTEIEAPLLPRQVSAAEFRNPPFQLERELYERWTNQLNANQASQPLIWTHWHVHWIEQGQFGERLDEALLWSLSTGAEEKKPEDAVRNLLRRLGGLSHVRGKVSVLSDCPFSRAWWRGRISNVVSSASEGTLGTQAAHRVLHSNNDAWARLVGDSVRRITVANNARLLAALLCQYDAAGRDGDGVPAQEIQRALRLLARRGSILAFDAVAWSELLDIAQYAVSDANGHAG